MPTCHPTVNATTMHSRLSLQQASWHPQPKTDPDRVAVLDGLWLVAALMVVTFHYTGHDMYVNKAWGVPANTLFGGLRHFSSYGWMGVELFFLISGFVICMSSWGALRETSRVLG